jgi:Na+:H+ antiporter, NhaA family
VPFAARLRSFLDNSGLLIIGATLALLWANVANATYDQVAQHLYFPVNDIGMAFFFALATKEVVEATAPGGALHSPRKAALPLVAAVGGMLGPALIFIGLLFMFDRPDLERGWAIPCATDIAFSYLAARFIFGPRHPAVPFLVLLAIADDALGLLIIAAFYPTNVIRPVELAILLSSALLVAWALRRRKTLNSWPYVLGAGVLSWLAFYRGGLHPALALVPIVPFMPHASRDPGLFVRMAGKHDTLNEFEHQWKLPVQLILFFFGLANAGVTLTSAGAGTWVVLTAIVLGKPIGIAAATATGTAAGLRRPSGITWRDLTVIGFVAGIGFTVALFFATAAFPRGHLLNETKMGALMSCLAAGLAVLAAMLLRVGRWQRQVA